MTAVGLFRGLVVFILSKMRLRKILALNHLKLFFFYLPLSLHPGQKIGTLDPLYWQKDRNSRPELLPLTLFAGLEPADRLQTGIRTLCSFTDWTEIKIRTPSCNRAFKSGPVTRVRSKSYGPRTMEEVWTSGLFASNIT
jgi:hypothetical protein